MNLPNEVFVDTSFFIALLNTNDSYHAKAIELQAQLIAGRNRKVTSEYILLELGDGLSKLRFRHLASQLISLVYQDQTFDVIPTSQNLFANAVQLFQTHTDKEWGLTDCTSFTIMQILRIDAALTADHHFQQAGYRALLLEI